MCKGDYLELDAFAIGERIREIRKNSHISQERFAELICTSTQTISNIETGKVIPNIQTLANIAESCRISLDTIVGMK